MGATEETLKPIDVAGLPACASSTPLHRDFFCMCRSFGNVTETSGSPCAQLTWKLLGAKSLGLTQLGDIAETGLHTRVFACHAASVPHVAVVFHEDDDDSDGSVSWEEFSLYYRNLVHLNAGGWAAPNTLLSSLAMVAQLAVHGARRTMGIDFHSQATQVVQAVQTAVPGSKLFFT